MQEIAWSPEDGRNIESLRLRAYSEFQNVLPNSNDPRYVDERTSIVSKCLRTRFTRSGLLSFDRFINAKPNYMHFQLRNLVWATNSNSIYFSSNQTVSHLDCSDRFVTPLLDLSGSSRIQRLAALGPVQISSLCVSGPDDLAIVGGFNSEIVIYRLSSNDVLFSRVISHGENRITNGLNVHTPSSKVGPHIVSANNDNAVQVLAPTDSSYDVLTRWQLPWAVNYAAVRDGSDVAVVVGDSETALVMDLYNGTTVAGLKDHYDFTFAAAWHPGGVILATGNQDSTTKIWDLRHTKRPLCTLAGRMRAIRSLRFSPDGGLLAAAEPMDFVRLFDVSNSFETCQEIQFFGDVVGISFAPTSALQSEGVYWRDNEEEEEGGEEGDEERGEENQQKEGNTSTSEVNAYVYDKNMNRHATHSYNGSTSNSKHGSAQPPSRPSSSVPFSSSSKRRRRTGSRGIVTDFFIGIGSNASDPRGGFRSYHDQLIKNASGILHFTESRSWKGALEGGREGKGHGQQRGVGRGKGNHYLRRLKPRRMEDRTGDRDKDGEGEGEGEEQ
eukprot:CAMPEP_0175051130 /NCGR_PEP_ID=MMETSP0052_2-20121109/7626_1 /TAXON_ID=51329 ORGANISM="Polytomella parva, Strain SAG 63-3" /NCGR_SAMPLE_ID=MMETSP0052_2 /ASSEMBLY_ACC=CAM_ASM_000194 /LENGTH=553 /DNA_ID=CAMNT_0016315375 /DNA_START=436 /DNA_END=2097 /DNA_ORIENTATION=+